MIDRCRIVLLDDNEGFLRSGLLALEQAGYVIERFASSAECLASVVGDEGPPLILFVDHDLGGGEVGYDVVRKVRSARADGLYLPIVYLTGRETESGYLTAESEDPMGSPSFYLSKRALVGTDLEAMVEQLVGQYMAAAALADAQATRRAVAFFDNLPDTFLAEM